MIKVSRAIFYEEKDSILSFLGEGSTIERYFLDKLRKCSFIKNLDNVSDIILRLFNNACYICTLAFYEDYPLLELKEYEKIAIDGHDDLNWTNHIEPATMALVVNWLRSEDFRNILKGTGRVQNIEELCKEICVSIANSDILPCEVIEEFQSLIECEHHLPSGFISKTGFQRKSLFEAVEDRSVEFGEILSSTEYIFDIMKNPNEFITAFGPNSYFAKEIHKLNFNDATKLREFREFLNKKFDEAKEEIPDKVEAFNAQTGLPCFTNRQMGILMSAVGRITEKDNPPGKTTIGDVVQRIAGYKSTANSQNMKRISESDKKIVADVLRSQFPNLADEVMKIY
jgi:hypothetical protein